MQLPFFKFYLRDWEGDAQLMSCSLAARGLLIHIMRVMKEAAPYGFFVGRNGEPIDLKQFAEHVRAKPREVRNLIAELEESGTLSRDGYGRLFSRRLVRENARSEVNAENGRRGGNPLLKGRPDNRNRLREDRLSDASDIRISASDKTHGNTQKPEYTLSLRSSAEAFGQIPSDLTALRNLAMLFVGAFANCRDESKAAKHLPHYAGVLAQMRSRGASVIDAWDACEQALVINGRPLFAASIKTAMSFLSPHGSRATIIRPAVPDDLDARLRAAEAAGEAR